MRIDIFELKFKEKFKDVPLDNQLFYNVNFGIRYELGNPYEVDENKYMKQVYFRSITLFEEIFCDTDIFHLIVDKRGNKNSTKFLQKYLNNKELRYKLKYKKIINCDLNFPENETNRFYLECNKKDIYYKKLLMSIGNKDFNIQPKIKSDEECYFVNLQKGIIFNQYDDCGVDIVASSKELIHPLYQKYNSWILQYDKERIDSMFI
ncbi:DUF3885 domain-containing protein [Cytobacillus sp. NCCP-133]|uniref:DUF3885 domain-containing protein n=1 Tax=Cytobacillus sp. NCCP-133 TaxID=766848 RepID=UPI00222F125E|nr:DUF3885 domain-containing protein [Cytobacillus sp. NCCP-133]